VAGRGDRRDDLATCGVDLVDAGFGDLVEVRAVERAARVAGQVQRARDGAAAGVDREQLRAGGGPDALAVVRDAVDVVGAGKRALLAHDLGGRCGCGSDGLRFHAAA
jgi:hypothetical protein